MSRAIRPRPKHGRDCAHPDACCPACLAEENALRPDYVPPAPEKRTR